MLACFDPVVELEMLGHCLTPVVERVTGDGFGDFLSKLGSLLEIHRQRVELLTQTLAIGAHGMIEEPDLLVIEALEFEPALVLEQLAKLNTLHFDFFLHELAHCARLHWRDGVLKVDVLNLNVAADLIDGLLTVHRLLPAKVVAARLGKPLGKRWKDPYISQAARSCSEQGSLVHAAGARTEEGAVPS